MKRTKWRICLSPKALLLNSASQSRADRPKHLIPLCQFSFSVVLQKVSHKSIRVTSVLLSNSLRLRVCICRPHRPTQMFIFISQQLFMAVNKFFKGFRSKWNWRFLSKWSIVFIALSRYWVQQIRCPRRKGKSIWSGQCLSFRAWLQSWTSWIKAWSKRRPPNSKQLNLI